MAEGGESGCGTRLGAHPGWTRWMDGRHHGSPGWSSIIRVRVLLELGGTNRAGASNELERCETCITLYSVHGCHQRWPPSRWRHRPPPRTTTSTRPRSATRTADLAGRGLCNARPRKCPGQPQRRHRPCGGAAAGDYDLPAHLNSPRSVASVTPGQSPAASSAPSDPTGRWTRPPWAVQSGC